MSRLSLRLLGRFELRRGSDARLPVVSRKAKALLTYLALTPGRPHSRDKLAALLWPEMAERGARHAVRQTLLHLRRALGRSSRALLTEGDTLALAPSQIEVDVAAFERLARRASRPALAAAVDLYGGDLLDGFTAGEDAFDEWLDAERARIRELAVTSLGALLAIELKSADDEAAAGTADRLLALDPLQEAAHRALMRIHARRGRRASAVRQYQSCVQLLQRELGAEPEAATRQLYQQILRQTLPGAGGAPSAPPAGAQAAAPVASSPDLPDAEAPLIGRDAELAVLRERLKDAHASRGQMIAVTGEAGIGKTRLVGELLREAVRAGARILIARCRESEAIFPFAPWVEALRGGHVVGDPRLMDALDGPRRGELGRLLPEIAMPSAAPPPSPEGSLRLFEAVTAVVLRLASERALVLVLEDLQWADEMTLRLVSYVSRRIRGHRVLLVGTFRDEELAEAPVLGHLLEELQHDAPGMRSALAPLTRTATLALVQALARAELRPERLAELGEHVWGRSAGNPFVIVETMRALRAPRTRSAGATPPRVRDVIAARLDRLSPRGRELAALAAVVGRDFSFALLARAAGLGAHDAAEAVEELVRRRVLQDLGERFDFVHDRIRDVVYERLLRPRRMVLHAAIGEALEGLPAERAEDRDDRLAYHFAQADDPARATRYLVRLADRALRSYALDEAAKTLQAALDHAERLPAAERDRRHLEVVFRLAHVLSLLGRNAEACERLRAASAALDRLGEAPLAATYNFWLGHCLGSLGDSERAVRHALQALEAARSTGDAVTAGQAHCVLAREHYYLGRPEQGIEHGREAVARLTAPAERWWLGQAWWYVAFSLYQRGEHGAALEAMARLQEIGETLDDRSLQADALWGSGWVRVLGGDMEAGLDLLRRGVEAAPNPLAKAKAIGFLGAAWLEAGDSAQGMARLDEALEHLAAFTSSGPSRYSQLIGLFDAMLAEAHLQQGDLDRARERATLGLKLTTDARWSVGIGVAERAFGRVLLGSGEVEAAVARLTRAVDTFLAVDAQFSAARVRLFLAEACHGCGWAADAGAHLRAAHATFQRLGVPASVSRTEALAHRLAITLG